MFNKVILVLTIVTLIRAQVPSLGWCPNYPHMANFDMSMFLGTWYEAERYFQLSEVVSRCVRSEYIKGSDGKLHVSNEVTNRFTGIKRVLKGEIIPAASKAEEGKIHVKYTTLPLTPETEYAVLETDYENYAVLYGCSALALLHAQSVWLLTRERNPSNEILQKAYGVLDRYKISKTFFVKTDQADCAHLDAISQTTPLTEETATEPAEEAPVQEGEQNFRSAIVPDAPEIIIQTRKAELAEKEKEQKHEQSKPEEPTKPKQSISEALTTEVKAEEEKKDIIKDSKEEKESKPETVPGLIIKTAEIAKEKIKEEAPAKELQIPIKEVPMSEPLINKTEKLEEPAREPEPPKPSKEEKKEILINP